jgi:hypothetical protein
MAVSAGLYGSENWVLTEKDKNRFQAAEMRFFRSTMGVIRQDRLTNEAIRKTLSVNSLNDTISKYRDNWFNHIRRIDHSRFPRYMLSYKPTGNRSLVRPRKRWISQIWGVATGKSPMHEVVEEEDALIFYTLYSYLHVRFTMLWSCILLRYSVALFWMSDQPVSKTSTYTGQHNTETQRQISIPLTGFGPTIPVTKRLWPHSTRTSTADGDY